jgi:integrase
MPANRSSPLACFYSATLAWNQTAVDIGEKREGIRRSLVNLHSFRRWFITKAEQADIAPWVIAAVVGHARQGMTLGTYSRGPSEEQLRECVEAVRLPTPDKPKAQR